MRIERLHIILTLLAISLVAVGCSRREQATAGGEPLDAVGDSLAAASRLDTVVVEKAKEPEYVSFEDSEETVSYMEDSEEWGRYSKGILPQMAHDAPEYAEKLLNNTHSGFIVVDKERMLVILYDRYGVEQRKYGMACAKNYGTKHKRADSRTPEGFFEVEGIYDSTDWLFTDDNGKTSKKKGQFGPRFIRLKTPVSSQIGIHGTCAPWSIGGRSSHGCIRIKNENILELVELVESGMPVIVSPGRRDIAVNEKEGYFVAAVSTRPGKAAGYVMPENDSVKEPEADSMENPESGSVTKEHDSLKNLEEEPARPLPEHPDVTPKHQEEPDTVVGVLFN